MKVTNLRRKLAATLVAGGLLIPVAKGANINQNLVVNPSFESVDPNSDGPFTSVRITGGWADPGGDGSTTDDDFAYPYSSNYAGVNTPAGAGSYHFTGGFATTVGQVTVSQSVDLSGGATGSLIPAGEAAFEMSAFFSTYLTQADGSLLRVRFLDAGDNELGSNQVGGVPFVASQPTQAGTFGQVRDWAQDSLSGIVPVGTTTAVVEIVSDGAAANHDGYVDLVDVRIVEAEDFLMFLEVNTTTGEVAIRNNTGAPIHIDYYEIMSDGGNGISLQPGDSDWESLQDQDKSGFPAGNGSGNGWEEAGGSDLGTLAESYLTGNSAIADGVPLSLGNAFNPTEAQDLTFSYGLVTDITTLAADYNGNNVVDAADYTVWRDTLGATVTAGTGADGDGSGTIDVGDYNLWKSEFGTVGGPGGTSTLITGFVRYVSPGSLQAAAVPEPSTILLVSIGFTGVLAAARWRK